MQPIYTAVCIEPRKHPAMEFVLRNFMENLDHRWQFLLIHGTENEEYMTQIVKIIGDPYSRVRFTRLPVANLMIPAYNQLMVSESFYQSIPTEMMLIFQMDTMILAKNRDKIYNFMKAEGTTTDQDYDYVGAPWRDSRKIGNGGLSLRKKSAMIQAIRQCPYDGTMPEDVFFSECASLRTPRFEEAMEFSVESTFFPEPFGVHACWKYSHTPNDPAIRTLLSLQKK